jgi:cell division transport system permease protein
MMQNAEEAVTMIVYFEVDTPQAVMDEVGADIETREGVASVKFVTADEAWDSFKDIYFEERPELAEGFAEDNPLADYSHYEVYLNDVNKQADLITYIESLEGVRRVKASQEVADILSNFNLLVGYVSIAVILLLLCVSVFLISNTVMIGISVRKEEIGIMKLIGASNAFVKAPFMIEGLLIGLVGAAIPLGLLYYLYKELVVFMEHQFNILTGFLTFLPVEQVFEILLPTGLILGVGIGFFGSFTTIRKHLRV